MIIVGITGGIGMGKSTVARQFNLPVFDADKAVHKLFSEDAATLRMVKTHFPEAYHNGKVNRKTLGNLVINNKNKLSFLERFLHPKVRRQEQNFLWKCAYHRRKIVLVEIPLLYETNSQNRLDYVVVASAPYFLQQQRVLRRPGFSVEKFQSIVKKQLGDTQKRKQADFVVKTGIGKRHSLKSVQAILRKLEKATPIKWPQNYLKEVAR